MGRQRHCGESSLTRRPRCIYQHELSVSTFVLAQKQLLTMKTAELV